MMNKDVYRHSTGVILWGVYTTTFDRLRTIFMGMTKKYSGLVRLHLFRVTGAPIWPLLLEDYDYYCVFILC